MKKFWLKKRESQVETTAKTSMQKLEAEVLFEKTMEALYHIDGINKVIDSSKPTSKEGYYLISGPAPDGTRLTLWVDVKETTLAFVEISEY